MGGIGQTAQWNQTDDSGDPVGPGLYHILENIRVVSGGRDLNATRRWNFMVGSSSTNPDMIGIRSSSICVASCGGSSSFGCRGRQWRPQEPHALLERGHH